MKKVMITGGGGFIGRNLTEDLSGEYEVLAPLRRELDLSDRDKVHQYLKQHCPDVIIHGAVKPGHRNAADTANQYAINLEMYRNVADCEGCYDKLIFLSSGSVYGYGHGKSKLSEQDFGQTLPEAEGPRSKYEISKDVSSRDNMSELRLFGVFGKYEDYSIRFISNAICKALMGFDITLKKNRVFDYLDVHDLSAVLKLMIETGDYGSCYNVTPDYSIELLELAKKVQAISEKNVQIQVAEEGWGEEYSGSNEKFKKNYPEFEFTPIEESVQNLYKWYLEHRQIIQPELLKYDK